MLHEILDERVEYYLDGSSKHVICIRDDVRIVLEKERPATYVDHHRVHTAIIKAMAERLLEGRLFSLS